MLHVCLLYFQPKSVDLSQRQPAEGNRLQCIVALVAKKTVTVLPLAVDQHKLTRELYNTNLSLKLDEWTYKIYFVGTILDEKTGKLLEYRDLIKQPELRDTWIISLVNKLRRLVQGISDVKGTNTIFFIKKSEISKHRPEDPKISKHPDQS